jgi:hypothetical protein
MNEPNTHSTMRRGPRTAMKRAALVVGAAMMVAPAAAGAYPASEPAQFTASTNQAPHDSSPGFIQHRDGSQAVPFVADVSPKAPVATGGFDWGDAGIGAGVAAGAIALGMTGVLGARRLKSTPRGARMPAATSS